MRRILILFFFIGAQGYSQSQLANSYNGIIPGSFKIELYSTETGNTYNLETEAISVDGLFSESGNGSVNISATTSEGDGISIYFESVSAFYEGGTAIFVIRGAKNYFKCDPPRINQSSLVLGKLGAQPSGSMYCRSVKGRYEAYVTAFIDNDWVKAQTQKTYPEGGEEESSSEERKSIVGSTAKFAGKAALWTGKNVAKQTYRRGKDVLGLTYKGGKAAAPYVKTAGEKAFQAGGSVVKAVGGLFKKDKNNKDSSEGSEGSPNQ